MTKHRCKICNRVDSAEIATEVGDFKKQPFLPDTYFKFDYVCLECSEEAYETLWELQSEDDFNTTPI